MFSLIIIHLVLPKHDKGIEAFFESDISIVRYVNKFFTIPLIFMLFVYLVCFKPASNFVLLIVPRRYFCGGSLCFMSWCLFYFIFFCAVGALCVFS